MNERTNEQGDLLMFNIMEMSQAFVQTTCIFMYILLRDEIISSAKQQRSAIENWNNILYFDGVCVFVCLATGDAMFDTTSYSVIYDA